jgi:hypothetical protein
MVRRGAAEDGRHQVSMAARKVFEKMAPKHGLSLAILSRAQTAAAEKFWMLVVSSRCQWTGW